MSHANPAGKTLASPASGRSAGPARYGSGQRAGPVRGGRPSAKLRPQCTDPAQRTGAAAAIPVAVQPGTGLHPARGGDHQAVPGCMGGCRGHLWCGVTQLHHRFYTGRQGIERTGCPVSCPDH